MGRASRGVSACSGGDTCAGDLPGLRGCLHLPWGLLDWLQKCLWVLSKRSPGGRLGGRGPGHCVPRDWCAWEPVSGTRVASERSLDSRVLSAALMPGSAGNEAEEPVA